MTETTLLKNIDRALADCGSLERNGQVIETLVRQLSYAGVSVSVGEVREALDAKAEHCPSTFAEQPFLSLNYGAWGKEYRFRPSTAETLAMRSGVEAIYEVTDKLDRTPTKKVAFDDGSTTTIETIRPRAFAKAMGHLRIRWAQGDLSTPRPKTIETWIS